MQISLSVFFVNVSLLSWNKMASISGRIGCQSSYRIDRMAIVRCRFIFLGIDWYRFFYCYFHFDCYLHFLTPHHSNGSPCASAVDTKIVFNKALMLDECLDVGIRCRMNIHCVKFIYALLLWRHVSYMTYSTQMNKIISTLSANFKSHLQEPHFDKVVWLCIA